VPPGQRQRRLGLARELTAQEPSAKYLVNLQPPLVRHFDLIVQAPGGVARLRELILTLAVQGKLVPQDPSDEPASELLKKIRAEKDRLIAFSAAYIVTYK
jgi:type I restriction enzyme, S subunit